MKTGFLGPEASYTQVATSQLFPHSELIAQKTIFDCFSALREGLLDKAVVPLENSIEGTVSMTLDSLYKNPDIYIEAEAVMPISHQLMIHPNQDNDEPIEKIYSHPQALAQSFLFLNKNYPDTWKVDFSSTSAAAQKVARDSHRKLAAVANKMAAKLYGLKIIAQDIQDVEENQTRFIVISKNRTQLEAPLKVTTEKTSILVTLPKDHSGGLHQVLAAFAWRKLNLSKIESRTLKTGLGKYFFFINIDGPWRPTLIENSFKELESLRITVKRLGHYPEYILNNE